eukprot:TRINITY_DN10830_c0_g2_i6.p2 TRINITY_DN10830_c0_g2~~TRINITY_DN10830_c0_g2_i6.p2  ORF type:complete len:151 (-),score=21.52 TRINITY_DN10830_c0_g2_i6:147-599(-)
MEFQVFEIAPDAKFPEDHPKFLSRSTLVLTSFDHEDKEKPIFACQEKDPFPEVVVTRCERQLDITKESEKTGRARGGGKMLFAGFNERCAERRKLIEQRKLHEQRLKEASMDKYPHRWTKKKYNKSVFFVGSKKRLGENNRECKCIYSYK